MRNFMYGAIGLLCFVLIVLLSIYGYNQYQEQKIEESSVLQEQIINPSIEDRIIQIHEEGYNNEMYDLVFQLSDETIKEILKKIGTSATYIEISEEYMRNSEYYVSLQIKNNLPAIDGPDAKNAKVKISTEINRPVKEGTKVDAIVLDSIK